MPQKTNWIKLFQVASSSSRIFLRTFPRNSLHLMHFSSLHFSRRALFLLNIKLMLMKNCLVLLRHVSHRFWGPGEHSVFFTRCKKQATRIWLMNAQEPRKIGNRLQQGWKWQKWMEKTQKNKQTTKEQIKMTWKSLENKIKRTKMNS